MSRDIRTVDRFTGPWRSPVGFQGELAETEQSGIWKPGKVQYKYLKRCEKSLERVWKESGKGVKSGK